MADHHKNTTLVRIQRARLSELQHKAKQIGIPASVLLDELLKRSFFSKKAKERYENTEKTTQTVC